MTALPPPPRTATPVHGPDLGDADFVCIAEIAHLEAGLYIPAGKAAMVRTRLARRLRALGLSDFASYCTLVKSPDGADERNTMISALTTNVSHFFREEHHFTILRERLAPQLIDKARAGRRVRLWSAGCSNGQEAYSIAMTLAAAGFPAGADLRILATDIDPQVIAHARTGRYPETMMSGLPAAERARHFTAEGAPPNRTWQVQPALGRQISFRQLNLLRDWPMRGRFDAIFCRNVVIYFDAPTQAALWPRFAQALEPGGWLFLGHSERISDSARPYFESRGMTSYQRTDRAVMAAPRTLTRPEE